MRILKPRKLMLLTKPVEEPPRTFLVITGLAMVDFADPEELYFDQALLQFTAKELGEQVFDLGMPKPRAELLVYGEAQAPGGRPVQGIDVTARLGSIEKTIRVLGDRYWMLDRNGKPVVTDPRSFTEMPLDYAHAFGGPDYKMNPLGKGHGAAVLLRQGEPAPLPNLEDPRRPVLTPGDTRDPACFAALDVQWPQRQAFLGTYDQAWFDKLFPGHPRDTNWSYYNAAPRDQWAEGFLRGDETFTVHGMDRDHPIRAGRLPGLTLKAFVNRSARFQELGRFEEVALRLDTVWLFGSRAKAILGYRGVVETRYEDASDIESVMLAAEKLDGPARPDGYYRAIWDKRSGDPLVQLSSAFADFQLLPPLSPEDERRREEARRRRHAELRAERAEQNQERRAQLFEKMGYPSLAALPDQTVDAASMGLPALEHAPVFTEEEIAKGEVDFGELFQWAEQMIAQAGAQGEALRAKADALKTDPLAYLEESGLAADLPPDFIDKDRFKPPPVDIEAQRQAAEARARGTTDPLAALLDTDALMAEIRANPPPDVGIAAEKAAPPWLGEVGDAVPFDLERLTDEIHAKQQASPPATADAVAAKLATAKEQMTEAFATSRRFSPQPVAPLEELDPGVANFLGTVVRAEAAAGASLAGRDFAGARLAGIDLSNRDLRGCYFEKADLTDADLRGADCSQAVFAGAGLDRARFAGAGLQEASFNAAAGTGVDFSGCDLTKAQFMQAKLPGASFRQAQLREGLILNSALSDADFSGATLDSLMVLCTPLSRVVARAARLKGVILMDLDLTEADFTGASLTSVALLKTPCAQALFDETDLSAVVFVGAPVLERCGFRRARLNQSLFREADLRKSDFSGAVLTQVDFSEADLSGASFWCASLDQCILTWTKADDATFFEARFLEVMMNRTALRRSNLARTRFYRTNARKVDARDAEKLDMILIKSMLSEEAIETRHDDG